MQLQGVASCWHPPAFGRAHHPRLPDLWMPRSPAFLGLSEASFPALRCSLEISFACSPRTAGNPHPPLPLRQPPCNPLQQRRLNGPRVSAGYPFGRHHPHGRPRSSPQTQQLQQRAFASNRSAICWDPWAATIPGCGLPLQPLPLQASGTCWQQVCRSRRPPYRCAPFSLGCRGAPLALASPAALSVGTKTLLL